MRTIKFKVLDAQTKELIGFERVGERGQWEHIRVNRKSYLLGSITDGQEYNQFLRLQFTGLTDKNGKEIYEGDIYEIYGLKFIVFFQHGAFCGGQIIGDGEPLAWEMIQSDYGELEGNLGFDKNIFENMEIIGNIHENPKLLK